MPPRWMMSRSTAMLLEMFCNNYFVSRCFAEDANKKEMPFERSFCETDWFVSFSVSEFGRAFIFVRRPWDNRVQEIMDRRPDPLLRLANRGKRMIGVGRLDVLQEMLLLVVSLSLYSYTRVIYKCLYVLSFVLLPGTFKLLNDFIILYTQG